MPKEIYDIAIIGAGAAGLQLALALGTDRFFADKKILLLEKDEKNQNDRTWSFWEKGNGQWDELISKKWQSGLFYSETGKKKLNLLPYQYKSLKAIDFYTFAKERLTKQTNIHWITEEVKAVTDGDPMQITGDQKKHSAKLVFDSRVPVEFFEKKDKYTRVLQHFKGWVIRTNEDRFEEEHFTMMDYRLRWKGASSFMYILPFNKKEAMVEFTFFSPDLVSDEDYESFLRKYIKEYLSIDEFEIAEIEKGIIPMSDFPFKKYSNKNHIRIGTAGGWVKPSTGYSFKNCERNVKKIIKNLKDNRPINQGIFKPRFELYDAIFLNVLFRYNYDGHKLFETMYFKNDIQTILSFLDETTNFWQELKIMWGFQKWRFTRSFFQVFFR
ncbi:MAG: lycopene cyclase family protein [Bacteroidota bacterium]